MFRPRTNRHPGPRTGHHTTSRSPLPLHELLGRSLPYPSTVFPTPPLVRNVTWHEPAGLIPTPPPPSLSRRQALQMATKHESE